MTLQEAAEKYANEKNPSMFGDTTKAFIAGANYILENGWVSVEDRLPDEDAEISDFGERIECLVVFKGYVYLGCYIAIGRPYWSIPHIHSAESLEVTHWMPLPKPPKVG